MKKISLSQGKFALVDDKDYPFLIKWKWYAHKSRNGFVAFRSLKSHERKLGVTMLMHRVIMDCPEGKEVDHKDFNTLNNQRSNLRVCSTSQNCQNRRKSAVNTSGYKGVVLDKRYNKWVTRIKKDRKMIYLGSFKDKEVAALVYDNAARQIHGEFAKLNFA